jgi:pSer/pThr/pTyr-binding forkhead associated (FHA) protein
VHLCLEWTPSAQRLSVCDLSSSGTWVNGQRIEKGLTVGLMDGDCIDLGEPESNRFTVELAAPSAVTTSEHVS